MGRNDINDSEECPCGEGGGRSAQAREIKKNKKILDNLKKI
jgi:hypothetical protein